MKLSFDSNSWKAGAMQVVYTLSACSGASRSFDAGIMSLVKDTSMARTSNTRYAPEQAE